MVKRGRKKYSEPDVHFKNQFGETLMHQAVRNEKCSTDHIVILSTRGVDINMPNKQGDTPLHLAAKISNISMDVFNCLISMGAKVNAKNKRGDTPLHLCLKKEYVQREELVCLLSHDASVNEEVGWGYSPLHLATKHSNIRIDVITCLMHYGANIHSVDQRNRNALHWAVSNRSVSLTVVRCLIYNGVAVNRSDIDGDTPLHLAVKNYGGTLDIIICLVNNGADVNTKDKKGNTCLHLALKTCGGNMRLLNCLLNNGADVNSKDKKGNAPLHLVFKKYSGRVDLMKCLLNFGADLHMVDWMGNTVLHLAVKGNENMGVIQMFLKRIDVSLQNSDELTPLHLAALHCSDKMDEMIEILECGTGAYVPNYWKASPFFSVIEKLKALGADVDSETIEYTRINRAAQYRLVKSLHAMIRYEVLTVAKYLDDSCANSITLVKEYKALDRYVTDCLQEIYNMKKCRIIGKLTLFNLVHKNYPGVSGVIPKKIGEGLLLFIKKYPIYSCLFNKYFSREYLLSEATKLDIFTVQYFQPNDSESRIIALDYDSVRCITSYLSDRDLMNIHRAYVC